MCFSLGTIRVKARYDTLQVVTSTGIHLFPFRTETVSPFTPMILLYQVGKWVAANFKRVSEKSETLFFYAAKAAESSLRSRRVAPYYLVLSGRHLKTLPDRKVDWVYFRRSGRRALVLARACSSSHLEIFSWSPQRRISGTFQPLKSAGRV